MYSDLMTFNSGIYYRNAAMCIQPVGFKDVPGGFPKSDLHVLGVTVALIHVTFSGRLPKNWLY